MLALNFLTALLIFNGKVEPHFLLILIPFGLVPKEITLAPNSFNNFGAAL